MKMLSSFHCSLHSLIDLFINAFPAPELLKEFKALEALLKTHAIKYDVKKDFSIKSAMKLLRNMIKNSSVNIVGLLYEFNKTSNKHNQQVKIKKNRK